MEQFDKDGTGTIDFHEFLAIMMKTMGENNQKDALDEAFALFDKDGDGEITFADLKAVAEELNEAMTDEDPAVGDREGEPLRRLLRGQGVGMP